MSGKIHYCEQGSEEWFALRLGKVTATHVAEILAGKAGRKNYMARLVCERLTGNRTETYQSAAMKWGNETEAMARGAFEFNENCIVEEAGFVEHPTIKGFGSSPDGLLPNSGLEAKCPYEATHIDLLLGGPIKYPYIVQMQSNMMCAERKEWHYVDYDPRFPPSADGKRPGLDYYHKPIAFDKIMAKLIEVEVILFLAELDAMEKALRARM